MALLRFAVGAGLNSVIQIMLAFEIEIDGEKVVTAGVEDWTLLSMDLTALRNEKGSSSEFEGITCNVRGFTPRNKEINNHHKWFRWPKLPLKIGSVLKLSIIDTDNVNEPERYFRCDNEVQEEYTEEEKQEMRYKAFLRLKKEFEPEKD